ncbi:MAG: IS5 family transposase [Acidovorax sp.]|nr:MAG: IS5 family transposase [Acidovorax sp.]
MPSRTPYPSDLTDEQWALIEPFVGAVGGGPKEQVHPRREVVNAILYVTRTGVQWRFLPHDLPDWQSVYHYFRLWKKDGTWKRVHDALRGKVRQAEGRVLAPTAGIMDSQSVKASEEADSRDYDAGKQVKGRKRHLLVDVLGLVLLAWVTTADLQDRDAAAGAVLPRASEDFPSLNKVWADAGYQGPVVADAAKEAGLEVEIVRRAEEDKGFVVQKRRWVVERTNAWLTRQRRLARDYERHEHSSETFIHIAMTGLMLRRLA